MNVLIVYATKHGHTAKIADRIAANLMGVGANVDLRDGASAAQATPTDYEAVIVGASIHAGRYEGEIVKWAEKHAMALSVVPSAFFSVCLSAAEDTNESREAIRGFIDDFTERTGWDPPITTTFAGALQYREYGFMTRFLIKQLMRRGHHPTDTSRDYDYTDWPAVDRFSDECAAMLEAAPAASR